MIRVYDATERLFNHNGIKVLQPLFAEILKVDNGDYYIELEDTLENLDYYQKGMIIRSTTPWGVQGFRCDNPAIKNNRVLCKAWHLSYDAENYIITDSNAVERNCNDALNHFNDNTDIESPFVVSSDIATIVSTRAVRKSLFEVFEVLIGENKYGGHWYRDNYNFSIKANIGQDRGVVLAYNKNITDIEVSEIWDNVCTKILPYTTDGEVAILLDEPYVDLGYDLYDIPYTKVIKFDNELNKEEFETEDAYITATKEWLREQADAYLTANKTPQVNYSVSSTLDNVSDVGDTIYVKHPKCRVDITTKVISVKYDAIRGKYTKIEFGNFKREIRNFQQEVSVAIGKETDEKINESQVFLQGKLEEATAKINSVLGDSYVIHNENEILVVDKLPKEEARCCLKINSAGIGFSDTGILGTFNSAWLIDGTLDMQHINVLNLTASLIKGGTLKLGGENDANGTLELCDADGTVIAVMNKDGLRMNATNGDYVILNAEDGFVGYDRNGNRSYWADGDMFHMANAEIEGISKFAGMIQLVPVNSSGTKGIGFVAITN